jgi:hypothetical protein
VSRFAASAAARFGARPGGQAVPLRRKADGRRFAMLAAADEVLGVLPGPGESVHTLMTGFYDLMHVIVRLLDRLGPCPSLRIATLSYNARNLAELSRLIEAGRVGTVSLLCSAFFRDHNKDLFQRTREALAGAGGRVAAARNHCKVVCLRYPPGERLVLEGSANLRTNRNREQLTLVRGDTLHDWHCSWIDEVIGRHERDGEEAKAAAGQRPAD